MDTKIVYVVVSSYDDIYLEQASVSMCSVKYHMPDAYVVLLTDKITSDTLIGKRKEEIKYADEIIVIDLDGKKYNAQQRSRQLKTTMRLHVKGDFLYIDSDTVITRSLADIETIDATIAACRDGHCDFHNHPLRELCMRDCRLLDWPVEQESVYFNGGVMLVKDKPEAYTFFQKWNENLNGGYIKNVFADQPALAKTNFEMNHILFCLDDIWNCQIKRGFRYMKDAYIVHYLCTVPSQYQNQQLFLLNEKSVLHKVKEEGTIDQEIMDVIDDPFKGIAESTLSFSGEDLFFLDSPVYHFVRIHYTRDKFSWVMYLIRVINYLERIKKRYIRILQGRATLKTKW